LSLSLGLCELLISPTSNRLGQKYFNSVPNTLAYRVTGAATKGKKFHNADRKVYYQKSMEFIFEVVLLLAVGVLGLIGNISAIVLFARLENQVSML
jgi:hypothetical protein